jgi:cytochrome c peroxidase
VARALAAFERTLISARSPYDRYYRGGEPDAIDESAKRGEVVFFTDPVAGCFRCHGGFNFSDAVDYQGRDPRPAEFHNTGLYNLPGLLSYPHPNTGIYEHTGRPADVGKFKAPTLRNIALTAPYMHDGSIATLEEVLDHYAAGGRTLANGPYAGRGHDNPNKDKRIAEIALTARNREDLLAFLHSLTDTELLRDERFSDPWPPALVAGQVRQ